MADYLIQNTTLNAIADAINAKTGGSSAMTPAQMVTAIGTISGGSGYHETGTVAFHTGENSNVLVVPIPASAEALTKGYVIAVRPIKTWALVDGVWAERDSLDFTGITGFISGTWHPIPIVVGAKSKVVTNLVFRLYLSQAQYSNGTNGNKQVNTFVYDSENSVITFTTLDGYVCVTDGGLTFQYDIWGIE